MMKNTSPTPDLAGKWIVSRFGPPSVLEWQTYDARSELDDKSVLVRILVAGIAGSDNTQRAGGYPHPHCHQPGFTPGYDIVGEVAAIGRNAETGLAVGDRVASMCMIGGYATHIVLPADDLIKVEKSDDLTKVATLPLNYMTGWGMLQRSGVDLKAGSTVLISSVAGGVGTAIAQIVHAFDLQINMIGTCSPSKFEYVRSLGVTPIDRNSTNIAEQVRSLTGGIGVDVAYDAVGSKDNILQSHLATKADVGEVIVISVMSEIAADGSGMLNPDQDLEKLMADRVVPRMKFWGVERDYYRVKRNIFRQDFGVLLEKLRSGVLDPVIMKMYRLEDAVEANERLISGAGVQGKMIFLVDEVLAKSYGL